MRCWGPDPSRLQVNWGKGNKFHLTSLVGDLECGVDEDNIPYVKGSGIGKCNGQEATVSFRFDDRREPGDDDVADLFISCPDQSWMSAIIGDYYIGTDGSVGTESDHKVSGKLDRGNHQAHGWDIFTGTADPDETASEEVTADSSGSGDGSGTDSGSGHGSGTDSGSGHGSGSGNGSSTDSSADGSGSGNGSSADSSADGSGTGNGSANGSSVTSQQATEAPASPKSWWVRYLKGLQAAANDSQPAQATDQVQPEFTAWIWGY